MSNENTAMREVVGVVVSAAMSKSIVVYVERRVKHPLYGKYMKRSTKYMAHDPEGIASEGDTVKIKLGRPISKNKCWTLVEVISKKLA
jgi:small subunit ribosomal protein S17